MLCDSLLLQSGLLLLLLLQAHGAIKKDKHRQYLEFQKVDYRL